MSLLPVSGVLKPFSLHSKDLPNHILGDDDLGALPVTDDSPTYGFGVVPEDSVGVMVPCGMETQSFVPSHLLHYLYKLHSRVCKRLRVNLLPSVEGRNWEKFQNLKLGVFSGESCNLFG